MSRRVASNRVVSRCDLIQQIVVAIAESLAIGVITITLPVAITTAIVPVALIICTSPTGTAYTTLHSQSNSIQGYHHEVHGTAYQCPCMQSHIPSCHCRTVSLRGWRNTVGNLIDIVWFEQNLSQASIYWHLREQQRGTVSSNPRFQTVPFRQSSADLSVTPHHAAHVLGLAQGVVSRVGGGFRTTCYYKLCLCHISAVCHVVLSEISYFETTPYETTPYASPECLRTVLTPAPLSVVTRLFRLVPLSSGAGAIERTGVDGGIVCDNRRLR